MKHIILLIALILCITASSCNTSESGKSDCFGFKLEKVVEEEDTHGGLHGDGTYYLILDCSKNSSKARNIIKDWKQLPLSENLDLAMYGTGKGGYDFAEKAHWPTIENGVYKFVDHQAKDPADESDLLDRHSFNFSITVYDLDSDMLYYFELDT